MFSKTWSVLLIVYLYSDFSYGQRDKMFFREDYTYLETTEGFYKIHTIPQTWTEAKRECALEGASLFYPDNRGEANAVISFWNSTQTKIVLVYIGLSDITTEGKFETVDGKLVSEVYNQWMQGQPNDRHHNEDCVFLNLNGKMSDDRCDVKANYICKKSLLTLTLERKHNCNLINSGGKRNKTFFRKDYTYIQSDESFYKVHTTAQSFTDAKRMCALEGASLFYAENEDEANAVISFWNRTQPNIPRVFVGLSDIMAEGLFETVDQRPITEVFSRWQRNKPDSSSGKEDCVYMDLLGTMNDCLCDKSYFICKKSLQSLQWDCDCNMPNLDYTFNYKTGKCYKLHTTPLNWAEAYVMCRIENTFLAVISSRKEADYLEKLTKPTPKPRINEQYQRGMYHLGFHNRFNEGWQTVRGTPMNVDAADLWFDNQQPDGNHYEECGSMFFNGRLINTDCNTKSMFICEHEVESSN